MGEKLRLDKYLADLGIGTRSEVKIKIRKQHITVNGEIVRIPEFKIDISKDIVAYDGTILSYTSYEYYILNKPAGVISATTDKKEKTVLDLIDSKIRKDLFPVGRLDKDTEGLVLITNDGVLAHRLLSPKKHVNKVYYALVRGLVTNEEAEKFKEGLWVEEDFKTLPALLHILTVGKKENYPKLAEQEELSEFEPYSEIELTIQEGKFHQVKRMFEAVGKEVVYLKRISMGSLKLPKELKVGDYRTLTKEEQDALKKH